MVVVETGPLLEVEVPAVPVIGVVLEERHFRQRFGDGVGDGRLAGTGAAGDADEERSTPAWVCHPGNDTVLPGGIPQSIGQSETGRTRRRRISSRTDPVSTVEAGAATPSTRRDPDSEPLPSKAGASAAAAISSSHDSSLRSAAAAGPSNWALSSAARAARSTAGGSAGAGSSTGVSAGSSGR